MQGLVSMLKEQKESEPGQRLEGQFACTQKNNRLQKFYSLNDLVYAVREHNEESKIRSSRGRDWSEIKIIVFLLKLGCRLKYDLWYKYSNT